MDHSLFDAVERCWTVVLPRPQRDRRLSAGTMNASELMFFYGAPLAHVVQYEEHLREQRQQLAARRLIRTRGPYDLVTGLAMPAAL